MSQANSDVFPNALSLLFTIKKIRLVYKTVLYFTTENTKIKLFSQQYLNLHTAKIVLHFAYNAVQNYSVQSVKTTHLNIKICAIKSA